MIWEKLKGEIEEGKNQEGYLEENKVIRPKSRVSTLSKKGRQTDRHTFFFKKTFEMAVYFSKFLLYHSETLKTL